MNLLLLQLCPMVSRAAPRQMSDVGSREPFVHGLIVLWHGLFPRLRWHVDSSCVPPPAQTTQSLAVCAIRHRRVCAGAGE